MNRLTFGVAHADAAPRQRKRQRGCTRTSNSRWRTRITPRQRDLRSRRAVPRVSTSVATDIGGAGRCWR